MLKNWHNHSIFRVEFEEKKSLGSIWHCLDPKIVRFSPQNNPISIIFTIHFWIPLLFNFGSEHSAPWTDFDAIEGLTKYFQCSKLEMRMHVLAFKTVIHIFSVIGISIWQGSFNSPFFGIKQFKCMVILKDFPWSFIRCFLVWRPFRFHGSTGEVRAPGAICTMPLLTPSQWGEQIKSFHVSLISVISKRFEQCQVSRSSMSVWDLSLSLRVRPGSPWSKRSSCGSGCRETRCDLPPCHRHQRAGPCGASGLGDPKAPKNPHILRPWHDTQPKQSTTYKGNPLKIYP